MDGCARNGGKVSHQLGNGWHNGPADLDGVDRESSSDAISRARAVIYAHDLSSFMNVALEARALHADGLYSEVSRPARFRDNWPSRSAVHFVYSTMIAVGRIAWSGPRAS
jgi:hypothetical protein